MKKSKEELRIEEKKAETRKLSIKEGCSSMTTFGFGDSYISPYAIALKANNLQIGFLTSITSLVPPIFQIVGSNLMEKYKRRKIITIGVTLQALMWIPILLLSILMWKGILTSYLPIFLIILYSIYAILGAIAAPAWFSLMGDVIPERIRGKYFGKRNRITGAVGISATVMAAFVLDFFKTKGLVLLGFATIFTIACICRLIAGRMFTKHYDSPEFKLKDGYYFSFWEFCKKAPGNNFGKFVIYVSLINMATAIAGPFFAVYMLEDLKFSYTTFMLINISSGIASFLVFPFLGKISDRYGNKELLKFGSILIPFLPILWLFSSSPIYLILLPQLFGGVGWAAFNLAASNFIYDSVTPQRRAICISYYNMINGAGIFIGATIGGILAQFLTIAFMNKLLFVFLISGILRFIIVIFLLPKINEVKKVKKAKSNPILYLKEIRPMRGIIHGLVHEFGRIRKRAKKK